MGEIAPEERFHPLSTIFYYLMLDFYVKTGIRFSLRDKRLFEITEVEITRVDCSCIQSSYGHGSIIRMQNFKEFYVSIKSVHILANICFVQTNSSHPPSLSQYLLALSDKSILNSDF